MLVSKIINENHIIDSKSFGELSPLMKEAISDFFKLIEKETGDIVTKFENAVDKAAEHHNVNTKYFYEYFEKETNKQLKLGV
jgi:hypothetical protein